MSDNPECPGQSGGRRRTITKCCFVATCNSTSITKPNKRFLVVPLNKERREAWIKACGKDPRTVGDTARLYVCEDHFNFKKDVSNYVYFKYYPGKKIVLKPDVIPHIFPEPEQLLSEQFSSEDKSSSDKEFEISDNEKSGSSLSSAEESEISDDKKSGSSSPSRASLSDQDTPPRIGVFHEGSNHDETGSPLHSSETLSAIDSNSLDNGQGYCSPHEVSEHPADISPKSAAAEALCLLSEKALHFSLDKGIQTYVSVKEKSVMAKMPYRSKGVQCNFISQRANQDAATSPIRPSGTTAKKVTFSIPESIFSGDKTPESTLATQSGSATPELSTFSTPSVIASGSSGEYKGTPTSDEISEDLEFEYEKRVNIRKMNNSLCLEDPMYYLGIPMSSLSLITTLGECTKSDPLHIKICLKKIRLNITFKGLAYDFGFSESYVTKMFNKVIPKLEKCLSSLVLWPSKQNIKERLPISFRARYSNVQSIIDCFEIEIEKPSDPVKQTLTWSNYKQCNTLKYLISCTPDGYINFVSKGFGGRTSDTKITEMSGFLDVVPEQAGVMADRGFKGVAKHLEKVKCTLIRPPSVSAGVKSTEEEVMMTKRIASLRIHIERVIRRLREFDILKPHSCVHHSLVKYLDSIVTLVCGLVNLQEPLIKKYV